MKKTTLRNWFFTLSMAFLPMLSGSAIAEQKTTGGFQFQYAAKFVCGANRPGTSLAHNLFRPGTYATTVNVHNPNGRSVRLRKKIALVNQFTPQVPGQISKFMEDKLAGDQALGVSCDEIAKFEIAEPPTHGIVDGFLVIESTKRLDVIAVYTAGGSGGTVETGDDSSARVQSIAVEHVRERKIVK